MQFQYICIYIYIIYMFRFINALLHRSNYIRNEYKQIEIRVQKSVAPGPGIEPQASCLPGRHANHYTIATSNTNFNIHKPNVIVYRSNTFFTAIGKPTIFGSFHYVQLAAILLLLFILFFFLLFRFINELLHQSNYMRNKVMHNAGNNLNK